ncbi:lethal (3) 05822 [Carabus blaptoides fortunei]
MKIPSRPAPPVPEEQSSQNFYLSRTVRPVQLPKKKPPPRPPPPKLNNLSWYEKTQRIGESSSSSSSNCYAICKSAELSTSLIDLNSPPKDIPYLKTKPSNNSYLETSTSLINTTSVSCFDLSKGTTNLSEPQKERTVPTIIRAHVATKKKTNNFEINVDRKNLYSDNYSPPMPTIPPPSPPKYVVDSVHSDKVVPYGIALYNYGASHSDDLPLQVDDVVEILRRVNDEWLYGRVGDTEGMFPANFIDIQVPLLDDENNIATALYEFNPETPEDLKLVPDQKVRVIKHVSKDWLLNIYLLIVTIETKQKPGWPLDMY